MELFFPRLVVEMSLEGSPSIDTDDDRTKGHGQAQQLGSLLQEPRHQVQMWRES